MFVGIAINLTGRLLSSTSPASLFANGEVGVWYDPSQINTLFQDSAGTTPVTAPNQPVGLMLDKSQGATLGPELVTNGNFSSGTTGWTGVNATISVVSGSLRITATSLGVAPYAVTSVATAVGKTYLLNATLVADAMTGNSFLYVGTTSGSGDISNKNLGSTPQTSTLTFVAVSTTTYISLSGNSFALVGEYIDWDNISCKLTTGYPAFQPASSQRPTYGINPIVGTRNLLEQTEQFDNAVWTLDNSGATNPVVTANFGAAPDGSITADRIQLNKTGGTYSRIQQPKSGLSSAVYTFSVYLRNNAVGTANVGIRVDATGINCAVTDTWQRFSVTLSPAGTAASAQILLFDSIIGNDETADILAWGAQLELGSAATAYQKVVSQYEVTQAGVQSVSYLAFDGVDDGMVTNTITPAIDKVQVFAGLRKLTSTTAVVAEMSVSEDTNNGSFVLYNETPAGWGVNTKGTVNATVNTSTGFVPPITNVVANTNDISGDLAVLRVNGTQVAQSTNNQGTGNYLAYPLYLGRRGGSSLPFNGRIYSLIVRFGANLTDGQITATETWVNGETGAMTWILTQGTWYDDGQWYDTATWNDGV